MKFKINGIDHGLKLNNNYPNTRSEPNPILFNLLKFGIMSILNFLNQFILQWFFVRLTKCQRKYITGFELTDVSILPGGNMGIGGKSKGYEIKEWYSIQYWVIPLTGWKSDFKYLDGKAKFMKLTKEKNRNYDIERV